MNWYKKLFDSAKKDKTRQNLLVSVDDRLTGDHEALTLKTTSSASIIIEFNGQTNKMSVHPDDLQDALDRVKAFLEARTMQPQTLQTLGLKHIEAIKDQEIKTNETIKTMEKELDMSN
jgi:hypothetical protein